MQTDPSVTELRQKADALTREADLLELLEAAAEQLKAWQTAVAPLMNPGAYGSGGDLVRAIEHHLGKKR